MNNNQKEIIRQIIWLRQAQLIVNEFYKRGDFMLPIHLAMGHESIAVAVDNSLKKQDSLFLTHRNIHYNLARLKKLKPELDEYYLKDSGLGKGNLGSMNLNNEDKGIVYTSSILGNNLCVGSGYALGNQINDNKGVVFIVTGDGAIEEGAFYESFLFLKSNNLPSVVLVENNQWSLGTKIDERRAQINLMQLAKSFSTEYTLLKGNDPFIYIDIIESFRDKALKNQGPVLIEVELTTLGHWTLINEENPNGKFINYHAGPAPEAISEEGYPVLEKSEKDPLHLLKNYLDFDELVDISNNEANNIKNEIR